MNTKKQNPNKKSGVVKAILIFLAIIPLAYLYIRILTIAIDGVTWCDDHALGGYDDFYQWCSAGNITTAFGIKAVIHELPDLLGYLISLVSSLIFPCCILGLVALCCFAISERNKASNAIVAATNIQQTAQPEISRKTIITYAIITGFATGGAISIITVIITIGTLGFGIIYLLPIIPILCLLCLRPSNLVKKTKPARIFGYFRALGIIIGLIAGVAICVLTSSVGVELRGSTGFVFRSGWFPSMEISFVGMVVIGLIAKKVYKHMSHSAKS